jgi:hypothetical protein
LILLKNNFLRIQLWKSLKGIPIWVPLKT